MRRLLKRGGLELALHAEAGKQAKGSGRSGAQDRAAGRTGVAGERGAILLPLPRLLVVCPHLQPRGGSAVGSEPPDQRQRQHSVQHRARRARLLQAAGSHRLQRPPSSSGCCFLSAAPLNQPSAPHISPALPLTLTQLSQPAEARRRTGCPGALEATSEPLGAAGDQETAVAPTGCAPSICGRSSGSGVQAGGSGRARLPPLPAGPTHASTPSCQHCIGPHCRSRWPAHASAHKPTTQPGL